MTYCWLCYREERVVMVYGKGEMYSGWGKRVNLVVHTHWALKILSELTLILVRLLV